MDKMETAIVYKLTAKFHFPEGIDLKKVFLALKEEHDIKYEPEVAPSTVYIKLPDFGILLNKSGYATIYITPGKENELPKALSILWEKYLKKCKAQT